MVDVGTLSLEVPGGWSVDAAGSQPSSAGVALTGPSDAALYVVPSVAPPGLSAASVAQRLRSGAFAMPPGLTFDSSAVTQQSFSAGRLVEVPFTVHGFSGTYAVLAAGNTAYTLTFMSGGSTRATRDFGVMLTSLRVD